MITWRKNLLWIWTALFLSMAGFGFAYPIIPFYLQDVLHVTEQARRDFYIALFAFAGNLGFLLFSPIWIISDAPACWHVRVCVRPF